MKPRSSARNDELTEANDRVIRELLSRINNLGNDDEPARQLAVHIHKEHRTLVQSFFRVVAFMVSDYASRGVADFRNAASLEWARKAAKIPDRMSFI